MITMAQNRQARFLILNLNVAYFQVQLLLGFDETASEDELRKMMADIYAENINMKKHVSSAMRVTSSLKDENEKHER